MDLSRFAAWWPGSVAVSEELEQAVSFLEWEMDAETVVKCGYVASVCTFIGAMLVFVMVAQTGRQHSLSILGSGALAVLVADLSHRLPQSIATARRTAALGETPALVSRAVLRMRLDPTVESAAEFAAQTSTGPLAASLATHVRTARGTGRSGFERFTAEWATWYPSLRRSLALVSAAAQAPAGERARTLDRALDAVLDGTRAQTESFVDQIRGPTTAVYAFGVLLPLALVAVLPAASAAGMALTPSVVVILYDLCLPAVLVGASVWLLVRRPHVFPVAAIQSSNPAIPAWRKWAPLGGCLAGCLAFGVSTIAGPSWGSPLLAIGVGVGVTLVMWFRPETQIQTQIRAVESGLTDALYLVGQRVHGGFAVDSALPVAGDELGGAIGPVFKDVARVQQVMKTDIESAFLGPYGALSDLPSPRLESAATLLALAATEGRPAGSAIVSMADHLDDLQQVEQAARRDLKRVTDTLRQTGLFFAPLVGGTTVALASSLAGSRSQLTGQALQGDIVSIAIGVYILFLSVILTALSIGLEQGFNRAQVGYHVGVALIVAPTIFLFTVEVTHRLT